ncbi:nuclear transport factor 2 family protein [Actinosynnema sp. NPDC053489]|uniref:nuclear transport factor 2 family protein n=1 Tax=Actinosynnema sp. NPDC053489 TaxID=3363916 RepID=UPI0037CB635C
MTTTETPTAAVRAVRRFFAAFGSGDRPALLDLLADDFTWDVAGSDTVPWTGRRTTRAEVEAFLDAATTGVVTEQFDVDHVLGDDERAFATGSFTHLITATGKRFHSRFALYVEVSDDRITRYSMHEDSHAAAEAFRA